MEELELEENQNNQNEKSDNSMQLYGETRFEPHKELGIKKSELRQICTALGIPLSALTDSDLNRIRSELAKRQQFDLIIPEIIDDEKNLESEISSLDLLTQSFLNSVSANQKKLFEYAINLGKYNAKVLMQAYQTSYLKQLIQDKQNLDQTVLNFLNDTKQNQN